MINKYISINSDLSDGVFDGQYRGGIYFTMGPLSIHQFNEFANFGINGLRMFQYIRTKQGLNTDKTKQHFRTWIHVENKNLYDWFGVHQSTKWETCQHKKPIKKFSNSGNGFRRPATSNNKGQIGNFLNLKIFPDRASVF